MKLEKLINIAGSCTTILTTEQRISVCKRHRLVYRVSHISLCICLSHNETFSQKQILERHPIPILSIVPHFHMASIVSAGVQYSTVYYIIGEPDNKA